MSAIVPQAESVVLESGNNSAFDALVNRRIEGVLGIDGNPVEGSLWFARRVGGYLVREALVGSISTVHLGLATIDSGSAKMGLSVKHEALSILDRHSSGSEENPVVERVRTQFLASVAMQLTWDRELPDTEQAFTTFDARQFFSSRFSFETRRQLVDLLEANGYYDPEVCAEIESLFRLPPHSTDIQLPTDNKTTPSSDIKAAESKSLASAEEVVDSSQPGPVPNETPELVMCGMCWGQKKIFELSQNGEGLIPIDCGYCGGEGKVPKRP